MNAEQRTLKISSQARQNGKYYNKTWVNTPKLTLSGNWFEKAGFGIGEFVRVMVSDCIIQIIKEKTPAPIQEQPQPEPLENFVAYIDGLHYEGYSANIREFYPHQWEELLRQFTADYPRMMAEPETEYKVLTPIQMKRKVLSELSQTITPLVEAGEYETINEGLIDMYKDDNNQVFKTYNQWKAEGYQVKRGAKAYNVWAKPLSAQKEATETTPEDENGKQFFPLCFLFSNAQVEKFV